MENKRHKVNKLGGDTRSQKIGTNLRTQVPGNKAVAGEDGKQ